MKKTQALIASVIITLWLTLAFPLLAVGPATLTELTGSSQTSRPITLYRVFKAGDIANYPQPSIGGGLTTWQSNVMTRYRDAVGTCTPTGATNATPIVVTCNAAHGYFSTDTITCSSLGGNTGANGTFHVTVLTSTTFRLRGSAGNSAYTSGGSCTGPAYGSVQGAYISFTRTLTGSSSTTVDFINNANPCSLGNQATCDAAALTQTQMLAFDTGSGASSWGSKIQGVTSSVTKSASARTSMGNGNWRYWIKGPVVDIAIIEDASTARIDDFGWTCTVNCSGTYATATWISDTTHRSLHPMWVATFYHGYAGARIEAILQNVWVSQLQDQAFVPTVFGGGSENVSKFTNAYFVQYAMTQWRQEYWEGTEPGKVKTDLNLPYMTASKAIPNFDTATTLSASSITSDIGAFTSTDSGAFYGNFNSGGTNYNGSWIKYMPSTGGRSDIGPYPTWVNDYLYSFSRTNTGTSLYDVVLGNANVGGYVPMHMREDNPSTSFKYCALSQSCVDTGQTGVNAFGHPVSRDPRGGTVAVTVVAPLSAASNWTYDAAHVGSFFYIPYLITGDWYYLQAQQTEASIDFSGLSSGTDRYYYGHTEWGYLEGTSARQQAWTFRDVAEASFATPDAQPEKAYLRQWILTQIAIHEGRLNVTNGQFYSTDSTDAWYSRWQWGFGQGSQVCDCASNTHLTNTIRWWSHDPYASLDEVDSSTVLIVNSPLMFHYLTVEMGHLNELGFPISGLQAGWYQNGITQLLSPSWNIYDFATYRVPVIARATVLWYPTFTSAFAGFSTNWFGKNLQTIQTWPEDDSTNLDAGYPALGRAAASFYPGITATLEGTYSGQTAWNTFSALYSPNYSGNPKWDIIPRSLVSTCSITPSSLPSGSVGVGYGTQTLTANTCGGGTLTWTLLSGTLPTGLSGCNSVTGTTCSISGTPSTATGSPFAFTIQVTDGGSNTATRTFSITVVVPAVSPTITSTSPLPAGMTGSPYSFQFAATGTSPITWSATGIPAGLNLSVLGLLSGTPTVGGVNTVVVTAANTVGNTSPTNFSLTITSSGPTLDYTLTSLGPQHIVVGHYGYFNILGNILTGTDEAVTPTVSGLPTGVQLVWTNLIKFCCTTFRFGINGLNPAQLVVASNATPGTYNLTITYNTNTTHTVRTTTHTLIVDPVPAALPVVPFPANTALTGLAQWQANMITFGHTYCTAPLGGPAFEGFVWYYDGTSNYYQIANYTGDPQWLACAQGLDALYRAYVLQIPPTWTGTAGNVPAYRVFPRGLQLGYTINGVAADSTALQALQTNGYANFGDVSQVIDFLLSREISYGLETNLETEAIGLARIANFQNVVEILIGDFDQWFQTQSASFAQPFMVALASEALIQYYDATGDVRVPPLIKLAADQLRSVSYDSLTTSFMYYNQGGTPSSPYDPQCSNYSSSGTGHTCKGPSPDLNLLIVPIYGWVYQHTGDISYRTFGDTIFNAGVAGGFLGAGKQFSQNYRWSEKYINWRDTGGSVTISGSVVLGSGVTVH